MSPLTHWGFSNNAGAGGGMDISKTLKERSRQIRTKGLCEEARRTFWKTKQKGMPAIKRMTG